MTALSTLVCTIALGMAIAWPAHADETNAKTSTPHPASHPASDPATHPAPLPARPLAQGEAPAMSEIPKMKAQGERLAGLMEKLSRESDPAERRRLMAEAMCPQ